MKLIADCGSTKIDWVVLDGEKVVGTATTSGMNALMMSVEEMSERIKKELVPQIESSSITEVYYYGAGCIGQACNDVAEAVRKNFANVNVVEVNSDLLAAARALCGKNKGIACILGTGSNSCYYDGEKIVKNVSPLGYILGDEGSGAVLGKLLVGDLFKEQLPAHLCNKFYDRFHLDRLEIITRVYKQPGANKFLASLSPFLCENIEEPAIHRLVLNAFKSFFVRNVENYDNFRDLPCNFVGSVAYHYRQVLEEAALTFGINIDKVIKSPMEGLINYHINN